MIIHNKGGLMVQKNKKQQHILVKFKDQTQKETIKKHVQEKLFLKKIDTKKQKVYSQVEMIETHEEDDHVKVIAELERCPEVQYAQEDHNLYACSSLYPGMFEKQWALCNTGQANRFGNQGTPGIDINIVPAWEITKGSEEVVVAVVDTGTDIFHLDLKKNIYLQATSMREWDFVDKDIAADDPPTDDRHGTLVSGIIAADDNDFGMMGVAPDVQILPLRFMTKNYGRTSAAVEAIEYAKNMGVKIVNCSWADFHDNPALRYHIENSGMLFVCAAGNDASDLSKSPLYPACFELPNVLTVAAVNNRGKLWPLSNYGEYVHVAAPGTAILSTVPSYSQNKYEVDSGTSLAAPHVAGIAALIMSKYPEITPEEVKLRIVRNTTSLLDLKGKVKSGGIANAYKALKGV